MCLLDILFCETKRRYSAFRSIFYLKKIRNWRKYENWTNFFVVKNWKIMSRNRTLWEKIVKGEILKKRQNLKIGKIWKLAQNRKIRKLSKKYYKKIVRNLLFCKYPYIKHCRFPYIIKKNRQKFSFFLHIFLYNTLPYISLYYKKMSEIYFFSDFLILRKNGQKFNSFADLVI